MAGKAQERDKRVRKRCPWRKTRRDGLKRDLFINASLSEDPPGGNGYSTCALPSCMVECRQRFFCIARITRTHGYRPRVCPTRHRIGSVKQDRNRAAVPDQRVEQGSADRRPAHPIQNNSPRINPQLGPEISRRAPHFFPHFRERRHIDFHLSISRSHLFSQFCV